MLTKKAHGVIQMYHLHMPLETFAEYPKAKSYGFPLTIFYFSRRLHLTTEITIR